MGAKQKNRRLGKASGKLSKKSASGTCLECGECCRRYWITVLPSEAKKVARFCKKGVSVFLNEYCVLNVKLFVKTTPGLLTFPSAFFPGRVFDLVKKELGYMPPSFFIVPQVVLKRKESGSISFSNGAAKKEFFKSCVFLLEDNKCEIYPQRPAPCQLFPFIAMADFREQYPFCELYKKCSNDFSTESRTYYKKIQSYFREVHEKGFVTVWGQPPGKGFVFLGEKQIGEISLFELTQMTPKKE